MMKTYIRLLILNVCLLLSYTVQAGCSFAPPDITVVFPGGNVNVANKGVGDSLATAIVSYSVYCNGNDLPSGQTWQLYTTGSNPALGTPSGDILNTLYPGVGMHWKSQANDGSWVTRSSMSVSNNTANVLPLNIREGTVIVTEEFTLVKTGTINAGQLSTIRFALSARGSGGYFPGGIIVTQSITVAQTVIQTVSCTVTTNPINVNMGTLPRNNFSGIGSTTAIKQFFIPVECDGNTLLSFTIEGNSSDPQNGILVLDSGSTASGIGIQLLYQDIPLTLSSAKSLGTIAGGSFDISLQARYYQTGSTIISGTANTVATVTLTYN
ncbi:Fimbria adhesin protein [Saezia sanguinis]|uniref:Fimbria adhesin protein n=1 Tax=Saezia sanguinis TaxID=1965230 RepID=A0A433SB70_9BURK|nr:fimbrial protein [Saezia sanguinis]RUS65980.1 Fimbria adhesin protein [Saezia sanguinis]